MDTKTIINLKKPDLKALITEVLEKRFSPRVYADEPIRDEDLKSFFEAARWAPSSRNGQPWRYFYAKKGTEGFEKLVSCLKDGNEWAVKAPVLILACYEGKDDCKYDLGLSVMSLIVEVYSLGYHARQMGGIDREKAREILNLDENIHPFVMIAVGRIGDYSKETDQVVLEKDNVKRERKPLIAEEIK